MHIPQAHPINSPTCIFYFPLPLPISRLPHLIRWHPLPPASFPPLPNGFLAKHAVYAMLHAGNLIPALPCPFTVWILHPCYTYKQETRKSKKRERKIQTAFAPFAPFRFLPSPHTHTHTEREIYQQIKRHKTHARNFTLQSVTQMTSTAPSQYSNNSDGCRRHTHTHTHSNTTNYTYSHPPPHEQNAHSQIYTRQYSPHSPVYARIQ